MEFQFTLEPYKSIKSRYACPGCGKKNQFARYINTEGEYLADHVGRCNRESKCGYHYTPKQFYEDNKHLFDNDWGHPAGWQSPWPQSSQSFSKPKKAVPGSQIKKPSFIENSVLQKTLTAYHHNHFTDYLHSLFDEETVDELIKRYHIGTSRHWPGAVVFWQVDQKGKVRAGKIMLYNAGSGKRVTQPYDHITWIHKALKLKDFTLDQCLFGEHLLNTEPMKPVAIVESEKTAIVASAFLPKFIWLAAGNKGGLSKGRCKVLEERRVFLFPDLGAYGEWSHKAKELGFQISDLLERNATPGEREKGLDIEDYLSKFKWLRKESFVNIFGDLCEVEINKHGYPAIWDSG